MREKVIIDVENQSAAVADFLKALLSAGELTVKQGETMFSVKAVRTAVSADGRKILTDGGPK